MIVVLYQAVVPTRQTEGVITCLSSLWYMGLAFINAKLVNWLSCALQYAMSMSEKFYMVDDVLFLLHIVVKYSKRFIVCYYQPCGPGLV